MNHPELCHSRKDSFPLCVLTIVLRISKYKLSMVWLRIKYTTKRGRLLIFCFFSAGLSEDSDYTSDFNFPVNNGQIPNATSSQYLQQQQQQARHIAQGDPDQFESSQLVKEKNRHSGQNKCHAEMNEYSNSILTFQRSSLSSRKLSSGGQSNGQFDPGGHSRSSPR